MNILCKLDIHNWVVYFTQWPQAWEYFKCRRQRCNKKRIIDIEK